MHWYALHVRSCQERIVTAKLESCGIEAFYPHVIQKSRDGRRQIEHRFMPGYVFGRFSLEERTPVVAINQVVSIVGSGRHHAVSIPEYEIEAVRTILTTPEILSPCDYLKAGDLVRVRSGPLTGLEGFVVRKKGQSWVVVSVTMLERSVCAQVEPHSLEFIGHAKAAA